MAFDQIPTSVTIINSGLIGYQGISLTDFTLSSASLIAAGSAIEISGAYFKATVDITPNASSWTAITTATTAYLALTPSGTAGSQILSAAWVSTAPVWSTSKQGWYATAGSSARVVVKAYKTSNFVYTNKQHIDLPQSTDTNTSKDDLIAHNAVTNAHSATNTLTGNTIVFRDAYGNAKIAAPLVYDDIAQMTTHYPTFDGRTTSNGEVFYLPTIALNNWGTHTIIHTNNSGSASHTSEIYLGAGSYQYTLIHKVGAAVVNLLYGVGGTGATVISTSVEHGSTATYFFNYSRYA